jgi:hypothetical protein
VRCLHSSTASSQASVRQRCGREAITEPGSSGALRASRSNPTFPCYWSPDVDPMSVSSVVGSVGELIAGRGGRSIADDPVAVLRSRRARHGVSRIHSIGLDSVGDCRVLVQAVPVVFCVGHEPVVPSGSIGRPTGGSGGFGRRLREDDPRFAGEVSEGDDGDKD